MLNTFIIIPTNVYKSQKYEIHVCRSILSCYILNMKIAHKVNRTSVVLRVLILIIVFFRRNNNILSLHLRYAVKYPVFSLFRPNVLPLCLLSWTDCKPNKPWSFVASLSFVTMTGFTLVRVVVKTLFIWQTQNNFSCTIWHWKNLTGKRHMIYCD